MDITIWHNPRCSKSRQTLSLIEARGFESRIVRYLDDPPDAETLRWVLERLGMTPRELMRRKEAVYEALDLADESLSEEALISALIENPKLIERPVVIAGERVALGRPPERVLEILERANDE